MENTKTKTINLSNVSIPHEVLKLVPAEIMLKYSFVPFDIQNGMLSIAVENPNDLNNIENIHVITGYDLEPFQDSKESIQKTFTKLQSSIDDNVMSSELMFGNDGSFSAPVNEKSATEQPV